RWYARAHRCQAPVPRLGRRARGAPRPVRGADHSLSRRSISNVHLRLLSSSPAMCELLGMSANVPTDICFSFTGLMQRGGKTGPHRDGWGISFYEARGCRTFHDPRPSIDSEIAKLIHSYPIKSCTVICHIRKATHGQV